jgi:acetyltransferase-like isoleucine patch superfamily enzyme
MRYTVTAKLYLAACYLRTRIFYRPARIIRFPIDIRWKTSIRWGDDFTTGRNCRLEVVQARDEGVKLRLGNHVQLNDNVHIVAAKSVSIGNDVLMASKIFISDCVHGSYSGSENSDPMTSPDERPLYTAPVVIDDRVWLGDNVVIMPGVHVGEGAVIGASSVVTADIPANTIAVGAPARVIKKYDPVSGKWEKVQQD